MQQFTIGRNPTNLFVINHESVSSNHAKIVFEGNTMILQDLNSTNGTFVNDNQILKKKISENDNIRFGLYNINLKEFNAKLKAYINSNKTDFTQEFEALETIHKKYKREVNAIDKNLNIKKIGLRVIVTVLLMSISYIIFPNPMSTIFIGIISGGLVSVFIGNSSIKEKKDEIQLKYSNLYKCPKCEADLTSKAWNYWKNKGNCPSNNCDATWNKL